MSSNVIMELLENSFKIIMVLRSGEAQLEAIKNENVLFARSEREKQGNFIGGNTRKVASITASLTDKDFEAREHEAIHTQIEAKSYIQIQYRDIARMFVNALPVSKNRRKDELKSEYETKVDEYVKYIRELPENQKLALKMAYVFSSKIPKNEREDFYQELALCLLKNGTKDEKLAYTITRCNWLDFWRDFYRKSNYYGGSLEAFDLKSIEDCENVEFLDSRDKRRIREYLVGECEFENIDSEIDTQKLWQRIPMNIRPIVQKRMAGETLQHKEVVMFGRWVNSDGFKLFKKQCDLLKC